MKNKTIKCRHCGKEPKKRNTKKVRLYDDDTKMLITIRVCTGCQSPYIAKIKKAWAETQTKREQESQENTSEAK